MKKNVKKNKDNIKKVSKKIVKTIETGTGCSGVGSMSSRYDKASVISTFGFIGII